MIYDTELEKRLVEIIADDEPGESARFFRSLCGDAYAELRNLRAERDMRATEVNLIQGRLADVSAERDRLREQTPTDNSDKSTFNEAADLWLKYLKKKGYYGENYMAPTRKIDVHTPRIDVVRHKDNGQVSLITISISGDIPSNICEIVDKLEEEVLRISEAVQQ